MLIIKPGVSAFDPSIFWIIIAVLGTVIRDLVTRTIPDSIASSVISFQGFLAVILVSILLLLTTYDTLTAMFAHKANSLLRITTGQSETKDRLSSLKMSVSA